MKDCLFCKIANKEIPTDMVYEDDKIVCFRDLQPQAPVHVLIVPKRHIASIDDLKDGDQDLMGYMIMKVRDIAKLMELDNGYRMVINCGEDGQQTVKHIHIHLLGKRKMIWPPG